MLDAEAIGLVEQQINHVYQTQNILEKLDWILEIDRELESLNDFALGYFLGALVHIAVHKAEVVKIQKFDEQSRKESEKNGHFAGGPIPSLTEEEQDEIVDIVKRWVNPFREKLNKEIALRKVSK